MNTNGIALQFKKCLSEKLKKCMFSLNVDEATTLNVDKILNMLVTSSLTTVQSWQEKRLALKPRQGRRTHTSLMYLETLCTWFPMLPRPSWVHSAQKLNISALMSFMILKSPKQKEIFSEFQSAPSSLQELDKTDVQIFCVHRSLSLCEVKRSYSKARLWAEYRHGTHTAQTVRRLS